VLMIQAHVNYRNDDPGLVADAFYTMDEVEERLTKAVHIRIDEKRV